MKKLALGLALIISVNAPALAAYDGPETYAQDKLANAKAQLSKLQDQKKAIERLIKAVKQDLKAAKIRMKAERIQTEADTYLMDASTLVEEAGVAVDLPNLMTTTETEVSAGLRDTSNEVQSHNHSMPNVKNDVVDNAGQPVQQSYGILNDSDLPPYIE